MRVKQVLIHQNNSKSLNLQISVCVRAYLTVQAVTRARQHLSGAWGSCGTDRSNMSRFRPPCDFFNLFRTNHVPVGSKRAQGHPPSQLLKIHDDPYSYESKWIDPTLPFCRQPDHLQRVLRTNVQIRINQNWTKYHVGYPAGAVWYPGTMPGCLRDDWLDQIMSNLEETIFFLYPMPPCLPSSHVKLNPEQSDFLPFTSIFDVVESIPSNSPFPLSS